MQVYLADQYKHKDKISLYSQELKANGINVCSSWIEEPHGADATLKDISKFNKQAYVNRDIAEIGDCDIFVLFTVDPSIPTVRGGRHFESGYAYGQGKPVLIVGPKENLFHYLNDIRSVDTWTEAKELLLKVAKMIPENYDSTYFQPIPLKNWLKCTQLELRNTQTETGKKEYNGAESSPPCLDILGSGGVERN